MRVVGPRRVQGDLSPPPPSYFSSNSVCVSRPRELTFIYFLFFLRQ